ncbi:MAG: hypothetical protein Aurels2KO_35270 [Aureliella sp.]
MSPIRGVDLSTSEASNEGQSEQSLESLQREFEKALEEGNEAACTRALSGAFSLTKSFAQLADEFVAAAFHSLGEKWTCGEIEIYQERRGCEICSRSLHEFRRLIPESPINAPLALGGSPAGDNYSLPSQLLDLVFRECSWRTMNLGCNLPLETIIAAAEEHKPRMVWLSASHLEDPQKFVASYAKFHQALPKDTMVVLGGRALNDDLRPQLKYTGFCDSMQQLASLATALHGTRPSFKSSDN